MGKDDHTSRRMTKPTKWAVGPAKPQISLGRVFAVCMKKAQVLSCSWSTQWRLWSDWADAQADQSLRWAHVILLVLSCRGSYSKCQNPILPKELSCRQWCMMDDGHLPKLGPPLSLHLREQICNKPSETLFRRDFYSESIPISLRINCSNRQI